MNFTIKDHINADFYHNPSTLREVTLRVDAVGGLNLGQGVCQLPAPKILIDKAHKAMLEGDNRYTQACGILSLREAIATQLKKDNGILAAPDNIIVTHGSTGAFEIVCNAFLRAGDKAIVFSPYYPYHVNAMKRRGVEVLTVEHSIDDGSFSLEDLEGAMQKSPKLIVICNPANPSGKVFSKDELKSILDLALKYRVLCVTDEVYQYLTYDGRNHTSMASLQGGFDNTITMGSYSKTFAITGWRLGYLCVPATVFSYLNALADQVYVCPPAPLQSALRDTLCEIDPSYYTELGQKYAQNRAKLSSILDQFGFETIAPQGAYYMLARFGKKFPHKTATEVVDYLIAHHKLGSIAASDFIGADKAGDPVKNSWLRFNFSIPDESFKRLKILLEV